MSIRGHLSDTALIELSTCDDAPVSSRAHLASCPVCQARHAQVSELLATCGDMATREADARFTPDRLARQHARILQRLDQDGRPARVIAFPVVQAYDIPVRRRPASRWIAAAAVAGLLIGLVAGRLGPARSLPSQMTATHAGVAPETMMSDDELLGQIERAIDGPSGRSLRPLDELTPTSWEVQ